MDIKGRISGQIAQIEVFEGVVFGVEGVGSEKGERYTVFPRTDFPSSSRPHKLGFGPEGEQFTQLTPEGGAGKMVLDKVSGEFDAWIVAAGTEGGGCRFRLQGQDGSLAEITAIRSPSGGS